VKPAGDLPATSRSETAFQVADLKVDPKSCEVVGPGGRERLDPKVMDVFAMLVRHAGQVVLRDDLLQQVWPNVVVTDEVLSRCIYVLRSQLSQAGGSDEYRKMIETVPKRGYRLNAPITPEPPHTPEPRTPGPTHAPAPAGSRAANRRWLVTAGAVGIGVLLVAVATLYFDRSPATSTAIRSASSAPSIAVLPFADLSENRDKRYYADGIAEEILNRLAQAQDLRVISRTSSFSFSDRPPDVQEIAAKLDVSHVLEGSLRWSGDRVRVTAQLIDAANDSHAWSASYDRNVDDLFAVQDEVAAEIATALHVTFAGDPQRSGTTVSAAALERYLQGRYFYNRSSEGDIVRATEYFEEAVAIQPRYALAWAALADSYSQLGLQEKQGNAARRAVESDPGLAAAHSSLAGFYFEKGEFQKMDASLSKAAELDPDNLAVLDLQIIHAVDWGDMDTAVRLQRQVVAQDPLSPVLRNNLAVYLIAAGHLDEALSEYRKAVDIHPDAGTERGLELDMEMARILVLQRRFEDAWKLVERISPGKYRDHAVALLYAAAPDRQAEADSALRRLAAATETIPDSVRLAETYAYRGEYDEAMATLEGKLVALDDEVETALQTTWYLRHECMLSPFLKPLHADPRWAKFIADDS
jgi:TolB-like protein/DNA-binding winged helix-turn-helix (wHTH) protein/thioredoxin-like negative regulator of GroEL